MALRYSLLSYNSHALLWINSSAADKDAGWLRFIIQDCDDPIAGIQYLLNCLNEHKDAINTENREHTINTPSTLNYADNNSPCHLNHGKLRHDMP